MFSSENPELSSLIRTMLDKDPESRPDIHKIRQNCLFSELPSRVVNPQFNYDLSLPLESIEEDYLSEVSCFCDIPIETLVLHLQSSDSTIYKLFYYLEQEKYFPVFPQGNWRTCRRSFSLPSHLCLYDSKENTISRRSFEQSYAETMMKAKKFFLKSCYCVSMQEGGGLNAVLNSVHDNRVYLTFCHISSGGCELVVSHPPNHHEVILNLFQFLQ
jgi:serine/threonine protein kinase